MIDGKIHIYFRDGLWGALIQGRGTLADARATVAWLYKRNPA